MAGMVQSMIPLAVEKVETNLPPYHVIVTFGKGFAAHSEAQSKVMFAMEKALREMGIPAEVYKMTKEDDSKLRRNMTEEERKRL